LDDERLQKYKAKGDASKSPLAFSSLFDSGLTAFSAFADPCLSVFLA